MGNTLVTIKEDNSPINLVTKMIGNELNNCVKNKENCNCSIILDLSKCTENDTFYNIKFNCIQPPYK